MLQGARRQGLYLPALISLAYEGRNMSALAKSYSSFTVRPLSPKVVLWLPKQLFPESLGCFKAPDGKGYICPP